VSELSALIDRVSPGVAQVLLERDRETIGRGSGFVVEDGRLITAFHVLMQPSYDTVRIRFHNQLESDGVRVNRTDLLSAIVESSPEQALDYATVRLDEPEMDTSHKFAVDREAEVRPGKRVVVMGFPYGRPFLASHVAYVSATYQENPAVVLQLDGSVNPAHSGGPVLDPETGNVVAYAVRAHTGLANDFDDLVTALDANISALAPSGGGRVVIGGIDPRDAFRATMIALRQLAESLRRSANVGIGFAFSAAHLPD